MKSDPLISVIIPFYNAEQFIQQAIESVLDQTYSNIEVVTIDDESTDCSNQICQSFKEKVSVLKVSRSGACAARNIGLQQAKGQFIQFMDADDILLPEKFQKQLNFLLSNQFDSVTCNRILIDEEDKLIYTPSRFPKRIQQQDPFLVMLKYNWPGKGGIMQTQAPLHRRSALEKINGFRKMIQFAEDKDLAVRLAASDAKIGYIDEVLWEYRVHSPQNSASQMKYPDTIHLQTVIDLAQYLMNQPVYRMTRVRRKALALEILKMARFARRSGFVTDADNGYECARMLLRKNNRH